MRLARPQRSVMLWVSIAFFVVSSASLSKTCPQPLTALAGTVAAVGAEPATEPAGTAKLLPATQRLPQAHMPLYQPPELGAPARTLAGGSR